MAETAESQAGLSPKRLAVKHQQVLYADYFQLLEIERDADELAISRAITALTTEFDPRAAGALPAEQAAKLKQVVAVLQDAVLVMGDRTLRSRYAAQLAPGPTK